MQYASNFASNGTQCGGCQNPGHYSLLRLCSLDHRIAEQDYCAASQLHHVDGRLSVEVSHGELLLRLQTSIVRWLFIRSEYASLHRMRCKNIVVPRQLCWRAKATICDGPGNDHRLVSRNPRALILCLSLRQRIAGRN